MLKYPIACAGIFLRDKDNHILLVKSWKWGKGRIWSIPGGKVKLGETVKEALLREAKEELGVEVKFRRIFAIFDAINPKSFFEPKHFIFMECECLLKKGQTVKPDHKEIQLVQWFSLSEALKQDVEYWAKKALKKLDSKITTDVYQE